MRLRASRLAWLLCGVSLTLTALGTVFMFLDSSFSVGHVFNYWVDVAVMSVAFSTVGAVIASRRPGISIGWIMCAVGILSGLRGLRIQYVIYAFVTAPGALPGAETLALVTAWDWVPYVALLVFLGLLFPDGRLPGRRWRLFAWSAGAVTSASIVALAILPQPFLSIGSTRRNPIGVESIDSFAVGGSVQAAMYSLALVSAASLFVRLRRASGVERRQLEWVTSAGAVAAVGAMSNRAVYPVVEAGWVWWSSYVLMMAGLVGIPVAMGVAILKHRLFDIDLVINRTLVYAALTACVVGLHALVVGGFGALFHARGGPGLSLFATGLVAVSFAPLRYRLQRGVDRLMYGERDEPYRVLSRLGRRLEAALAPDAALSTIVETVAQALKLPHAAISLKQGDEFATVAEYGTAPRAGEPVVLSLMHGGEEVGRLLLSPRAPGEVFSPSDQGLLEDLARQAGATVQAVRLTADLQRSREKLVTAREEERRRLRRDLHDDLGPRLASLTLKQDAARRLLVFCGDTAAAAALMAELKGQTRDAVADIRRLAYELRPPTLDEMGLVPAIREGAAKHEASSAAVFSVEAPDAMPPLSAASEVALYRIAQEAMINVVRHARAKSCAVRLTLRGGELELEVLDDGDGIPNGRRAGIGLSSMRERAAELGGTCTVTPAEPSGSGTLVRARLPLETSGAGAQAPPGGGGADA
ncbi:histidine kinase [Rubrobacter marinus]|uniref:Oxygen sensor histidine kinase NreB n=1 Tax=Rubrobacter marinus TaxID=2653852 RepID=A0A6G8PTQ6_9ACTN|nr:GAF domain-containing sensor histidine kinase [Rubrobacter marinus]QIN77713.1 histidine kinase [Rubrobacter marinus]